MKVCIEFALMGMFACVATVASVSAAAQTTDAAPSYRLTVMQPLPGQNDCNASSLNDRGQATGYCMKFDENAWEFRIWPYLWQGGSNVAPLDLPPRDFPFAPMYGINNKGWITGIFDASAVIFKGPGNIETIAHGPAGWGWFPSDINSRGDVVGRGEHVYNGERVAFVYMDGVKTDLTSVGMYDANAINYLRQVAGGCSVAAPDGGTEGRACVYAGGRAVPLPGRMLRGSRAVDLNNKGQVVGWYTKPGAPFVQGFLHQRGVNTDLGPWLPESINGSGTIVGNRPVKGSTRIPFVRTGGRVYELRSVVHNLGDFVPNYVKEINEAGAIVGDGYYKGKPNQGRGFILHPAR